MSALITGRKPLNRLTRVDSAAGDRVLVASHTPEHRNGRAARADGDVQARDVDADERLDEVRDTRVARVLDLLAALGRARRRAAAGATVPGSGRGDREGGEDGEGEDLGEHRGGGGG
jgi:hypothetical protein